MDSRLCDLYTDYPIFQNKYATATGLSELLPNELSHDQITRFLNGTLMDSKALWMYVKSDLGKI